MKVITRVSVALKLSFCFCFLVFVIILLSYFIFSKLAKDLVFGIHLGHAELLADEFRKKYSESGQDALKEYFLDKQVISDENFYMVGKLDAKKIINIPENELDISFEKIENLSLLYDLSFDMKSEVLGGIFPKIESKTISTWSIARSYSTKEDYIEVGISNLSIMEKFLIWKKSFIFFGLMILLFTFLLVFLLVSYLLRPLKQIKRISDEIIWTGNLEKRVDLEREISNDLNAIIVSYNKLLDKNQRLLLSMENSLDYVAHDLRTPITRMHSAIENAFTKNINGENSREELIETLEDCAEENQNLSSILNSILDLSIAESASLKLDLEDIDLSILLENLVDNYELIADEKEVSLYFVNKILGGVSTIKADKTRLLQVFSNILENSLKFTEKGGEVKVILENKKDEMVIIFSDNGIGIAEVDINRIWKKLYRADHSRSKSGTGLGLPIAKAMARAHKGRIIVKSDGIGKGTEFTVYLPIAS